MKLMFNNKKSKKADFKQWKCVNTMLIFSGCKEPFSSTENTSRTAFLIKRRAVQRVFTPFVYKLQVRPRTSF
jgi:hypothetical protein